MKRNYLKAGLLTAIFSSAALTIAITAAPNEGWHRAGEQTIVKKSLKTVSLKTQYRQSLGLKSSNSQLTPQGDCVQRVTLPTRSNTAKNKVLKSIENPRGNIYAIVNRHSGMEYASQAYIGKLDLTSGKLTKMYNDAVFCPYIGDDYELQGNVIRKGLVYCPSYTQGLEGMSYGWQVVELETGDRVGFVDFGNDPFGDPYALTYDEKHDLFYGVAMSAETGVGSHFCVYDPNKFVYGGENSEETGAIHYIKSIGDNSTFIATLAYDSKNDILYAFDERSNVYSVDPTNGDRIDAGYLMTDYLLFTAGVTGQTVYSPMDEQIISLFRDPAIQGTRILYIDPNSFDVVVGPTISAATEPYVSALMCSDEFADADAPELPAAPVLSFDKASLSGTVSFTVPSLTYYGVEIGSAGVNTIVKVDGNVWFEESLQPGETITQNADFTEGLHTMTIQCFIGDLASPMRSVDFYVGNDNPTAPTNFRLDIDQLTWKAPGEVGEHGGYVNVNNLEYNVYVNGVQQNANPIEDLSYTLRMPAEMSRSTIEVEAVAGNKASKRASLFEVIGKALGLPQLWSPTAEESNLFTVVNANNDEKAWTFSRITEGDDPYTVFSFDIGYFNDAQDWLITPAIEIGNINDLYNFSFKLGTYVEGSDESFAIYIGTKPTVASMLEGTCILRRDHYTNSNLWDEVSANFGVSRPGAYYIGLLCCSSKANNSYGMIIRDLNISKADGKTSAVPADPQEIVLTPGDMGEQYATISAKLPVVDIVGNALDPDGDITMKASCGGVEREATGKPGETVSVEVGVNNDGFHDFTVQLSNANGEGYSRTHRIYVGIDTPLPPVNIQGVPTEDNLSLDLTWDAPANIGVNGGFVDVNDLEYRIYTRSGVSYAAVGSTRERHARFTPGNSTLDDYYVGPAAKNVAGESVGSVFVQDQLGVPYTAPVKEYWNTTNFSMMPYTFMTAREYSGSNWENVGQPEALGFPGCVPQQGALIAYSVAGPTEAMLIMPKININNLPKANFTVRFWDNVDTPDINIYGRRNGHEDLELLHTFVPEKGETGKWVNGTFSVPQEYLDASWVQFRIGMHLTGAATEYVIFDTWEVFPDLDYDLGVTSFSGNTEASVGDNITYNVKVTNGGAERHDGVLAVQLVDSEGNILKSDETPISALTSTSVFERNVSFELDGSYNKYDKLTVRAVVTCTPDENERNNTSEIELSIKDTPVPSINDLTATTPEEDGSMSLAWSVPSSEYGNFDNFEYLPPFVNSDHLGMWKNYDMDGHNPVAIENGAINISWDGSDQPQGWTVVDAEALNLQSDPRAYTHSGKQYLMARAAAFTTEDNYLEFQSSKWLVSPEVVGGTRLTFWLNCLSTDLEYLEVWTSSTGDTVGEHDIFRNTYGDFNRRVRPLSKSGNDTWELIEVDLPADTKYFAIRYCSYDGVAVMIDDISFTPATMLKLDVESYGVYRSQNYGPFEKIADGLTTTNFVDADYTVAVDTDYYVVAYATVDGVLVAGPKSNIVHISGNSVSNISGATSVIGGNGEIIVNGLDGQSVEIYTTDGKVAYKSTVRGSVATYGVQAGIYLVKAGGTTHKVVVK